jgi:hypothetical protein
MGRKFALVLSVVALAGLWWLFSPMPVDEAEVAGRVEACVQRGVAYFKEVGSYPYLGDGQYAPGEARLRCQRSPGAF